MYCIIKQILNSNKISNIEKKSIRVDGTQIDPNLALCRNPVKRKKIEKKIAYT